jgi:hypothetical protein
MNFQNLSSRNLQQSLLTKPIFTRKSPLRDSYSITKGFDAVKTGLDATRMGKAKINTCVVTKLDLSFS